ncbi:ATP-dependent zinc protease [Shimia sp.]|uniref:ATP-dependent zinc protease family protein n=1 Tax=Shimia sp. TaxID=1954381 RepID=UPI00356B01D7
MSKMPQQKNPREQAVALFGWMEYVGLPELGLDQVKAKLDTGARTSAIHAENIELFDRDGTEWVRFQTLPDWDNPNVGFRAVEAPVVHVRGIKNTSGIPEERLVVKTKARFGKRMWMIDVSLADRTNMSFPMIIGRAALKNHAIAVHTRKAFLVSDRPLHSNRKETS